MTENQDAAPDLLSRVRKLLAKAEDESCTPEEAEALTAKAALLMARYGIDRALLGAARPETDKPGDRLFRLANPWANVKGHLLGRLAGALGCQVVLLNTGTSRSAHLFGYESDIERTETLYTSLLVQMARALAAQVVPGYGGEAKSWRRSWMLGYCSAVTARVRAAEEAAASSATAAGETAETAGGGSRTAALVLADRSLTVRKLAADAYPRTRKAHVTYTGRGYGSGYAAGQQADIGGAKLRPRSAGAIEKGR